MKKILILTHRLGFNYGGMLQAYALQNKIKKISADGTMVATGHLHPDVSSLIRLRSSIYQSLKRRTVFFSLDIIDRSIMYNTHNFIEKYIKTIDFSSFQEGMDYYIVGSDQVWRASYVDPLKYMFSDVKNSEGIRLSYAASFGTDDLSEYTDEQIMGTAKLSEHFSGISVRENSGIDIVKKNWNRRAEHHIDPTLLLNSKDYSKIIDAESTKDIDGTLFAYVLDRSMQNNAIINKVEKLSGTNQFELMPKEYRSFVDFIRNKDAYIMPKVEQWLRSFRDAEFVVTDSFHGTVFSIIFNKPFVAVGNKGRGLARFVSLLSMFGLQHRLVTSEDEITKKLVNEKIDWALVNQKVKKEQKRSEEYLRKYIQ